MTEANEIAGSFMNVLNGDSLSTIDNRFLFDVHYGTESIFNSRDVTLNNFRINSEAFLTSVPEPNGILLIVLASSAIAARRRRSALDR